jgi:hypothetical protein
MRRPVTFLILSCLAFLVVSRPAAGAWNVDGVPLTTILSQDQDNSRIVSDGAGGAIIVWRDMRPGTHDEIYAQRVDLYGTPLWTANGVPIAALAGSQSAPVIATDGAGGAIIAWVDNRGGTLDIYAQRVNASGVVQWALNGVAVCTAANAQTLPEIVAAGSGSSIIAWPDLRNGSHYDIFAQKLDGSGVAQWAANGVMLCGAANNQTDLAMDVDGAGGAVVSWLDSRSGVPDIYANRVLASGATSWTANGIAICTNFTTPEVPKIAFDGSGVVITWGDNRLGSNRIFAQRVNIAGGIQWTSDGVLVTNTASSFQQFPNIVSDGSGGVVIAWFDGGSNTYAQRLNSSGVGQWGAAGVVVSTGNSVQTRPTLAPDMAGGAIVTWIDVRNGAGSNDVYAQRVSAAGVVQWAANGVALCKAALNQALLQIVWDGVAGAIVTWTDYRYTYSDVYVQRVHRHGYVGRPEPTLVSVTDVPNDQGGKVNVNWSASQYDAFDLRTITHYSIWRSTDITAAASLLDKGALRVDHPDAIGEEFQGKAVWVQQQSGAAIYWEWIANQEAHYLASYTYASPTLFDWTLANPNEHSFFVSAHSTTQFVFFDSNVLTGHSVDNLAPAAPLFLTAQRVAGADVLLKWNHVVAPDLNGYTLYRATASGVTPVPLNFLTDSSDTLLVDTSAPLTPLYYIVTAGDVHGNQSVPSNEASVDAITGVGGTPSLGALTVSQNYPNPFSTATELTIGLPAASDVSIEVFDVAGRRVRGFEVSGLPEGWSRVPFRAHRDDGSALASGVYFCRITAAGATVTRKFVIAR